MISEDVSETKNEAGEIVEEGTVLKLSAANAESGVIKHSQIALVRIGISMA